MLLPGDYFKSSVSYNENLWRPPLLVIERQNIVART